MRVEHASKIGPCLWFDDQAEEAADFYVTVFSARRATTGDGGESKILGISRYGEAGPGPSYLDPGSGGPENDFTNRNTTFMTWNLLHLARMLKDAGGIPAHGNQRSLWDAGCRFDSENPEHR